MKKRIIPIAAALLVLSSTGIACKVVDAREVCVKHRLGKVKGIETGTDGNPLGLNDYACYPTTARVYETSSEPDKSKADYRDVPIDARTKDGQRIDAVTYSVRFAIPRDEVLEVFATIPNGMDGVVEQVVKFHSRTTVRQVLQQYDAEVINSDKLADVQKVIEDRLRPEFEAKHVILESFQLRKPDFNDAYEDAINKRQIAEQDAQRAIIDAQRKTTEAKAEADAARERAKGEADSIALRGAAIRQNPEIIQLEAVQAIRDAGAIYLPSTGVTQLLPTPVAR